MPQRAAPAAALDPQLVPGGAVPEERGVRGDHRAQHLPGAFWCCRLELQHPEPHRRDGLVAGVPGTPGGDEPAFAERGLLRPGHPLQAGADRELLAGAQVPVVLLLAVGGHYRGEPGVVEHGGHQAQRVTGVTASVRHRPQPAHGPDLDHRGRGDQLAVHRGGGRPGVGVDRVDVAHGLGPVPDHGQVHRVGGRSRRALPGRGDPLGGLPDRGRGVVGCHHVLTFTWGPGAGRAPLSRSAHAGFR